ncbi:hypothetical protein C2E23DRAFT_461597 [Lenzites betulinus]|nr:hypothetical protein C2E23DRAFT_461597 [Lenzites betulinus]
MVWRSEVLAAAGTRRMRTVGAAFKFSHGVAFLYSNTISSDEICTDHMSLTVWTRCAIPGWHCEAAVTTVQAVQNPSDPRASSSAFGAALLLMTPKGLCWVYQHCALLGPERGLRHGWARNHRLLDNMPMEHPVPASHIAAVVLLGLAGSTKMSPTVRQEYGMLPSPYYTRHVSFVESFIYVSEDTGYLSLSSASAAPHPSAPSCAPRPILRHAPSASRDRRRNDASPGADVA